MPTETDETTRSKSNTRKAANTNGSGVDDPDPASLPSATRINAPFSMPTTAPSAAAIQREVNKDFVQEKRNLGELLGTLEGGSGSGRYQLHLMRSTPRVWRGKMIGGYVTEYPAASPPSNEDIKQTHGGGTYFWRVMVPNQRGGAAGFGPTTSTFDIAGDPILPEAAPGSEPLNTNSNQAFVELTKLSLEESRKSAEAHERRMEKVLESSSKGEGGTMNAIMQMQAKQAEAFQQQMVAAQAARDSELKALQMRLDAQEKERKEAIAAAAAIAKEERLAAEAKAEREAKERESKYDRERADTERRHQESLKAQEAAVKQAREDADRRAQEARDAANARREQDEKNFQLQLKAMETSADKNIAMMQTMQTMTLQNFKELDGMKMSFMEKQLSMKPSDPLDQIVKWKQVSDILSGKEDEEKEPGWKLVIDELKDGIREAGPSLMAIAGITNNAVEGGKRKGKGDNQERRQLRGREHVKPNTVVEVDLDDDEAILPDDNEETNGLKALKFPDEGEVNPNVLGDLLMRNIDWAIEKDNNATWIVNNVIKRFPPHVVGFMASQSIDDVIEAMKEKVPPTWKLVSPAGIKIVREAHAILKKG